MKGAIFLILLFPFLGLSQADDENFLFYRYGLGFSYHEGAGETGLGVVGSFGILKSLGEKKKSRINSNVSLGRFSDLFMLHTPEQKYAYLALDFVCHFDLLRYKAFSLVTSAGGYLSVTSGKVEDYYNEDGRLYSGRRFTHGYLMASISGGLRIAPKKSKIAFEITPFKIFLGTSYSYMGQIQLSVDYKIYK
jgi:hypothetical protein